MLPVRFGKRIASLLRIQTEIFLARKKVGAMNEERFRKLLEALDNLEIAKDRNEVIVESMEVSALELIRT